MSDNQFSDDFEQEFDGSDDLQDGKLSPAQVYDLQTQLDEAERNLRTIRDFIRFCVSRLREYDVVVAQGTTDEFAE
ncbi:MAG: 50S ribosomal protein L3 N(5)-glutamine methyltransferase, partial [Moraxella sp.]|nr:50S ribosomal protein L3 N(5)-glutamine methyltransferase [Moraxella sp.]